MKRFLKIFAPQKVINAYRISRAWLANKKQSWPSRSLVVIGVTGTDGKTTTVHLIKEILEAAGHQTGVLSTIAVRAGGEETVNTTKMTSLNAKEAQKALAKMVKKGDRYAVVETSSHALDQNRVWGIAYDVAVITNTSHEHLDYHKTMEAYREAKEKLFAGLAKSYRKSFIGKAAVLNQEDDSFDNFRRHQVDTQIFYGLKNGQVYVRGEPNYRLDGTDFTALTPVGELKIKTQLVGEYNVMNILAAISTAIALGVQPHLILRGLEKIKGIPGRFERIDEGQEFSVIVDYAVTPRAFEGLYSMLQKRFLEPGGKIIGVFGATGERDRAKRPQLGKIAAQYCSQVYLTNEDPYDEDPQQIIDEVAQGLISANKVMGRDFWIIMDRGQAIERAISEAQAGDIVVITGKGAETAMAIGCKRLPWDDRAKTREAIKLKIRNQKT